MKTLVIILSLAFGLNLVGCSGVGQKMVTSVAQSQAPGAATGAGATIIGPTNSAEPTTQVAERRTAYYAPQADLTGIAAYIHSQVGQLAVTPAVQSSTQQTQPVAIPPSTAPQYPAWTYEKVSTTIGQHQDAAGLVKAAQTASGWPVWRWIGIATMVVGIGGWLYSYNNKETGYPLVWIKVFLCGAIITAVGSNPWLLLLLLIPLGFYAVQKLAAIGILRLPTLP